MDGNRFDNLTRLVGNGSSRRTILKGLLGLGGVAATGALLPTELDARTIGTRPTIPPPPSPSCALPKQMCGGVCCDAGKCKNNHCCPNTTDVWCGNACCASGLCTSDGDCCAAGQVICGNVCCDAGASCARDGNNDFCCDGPYGGFACGLECCLDELQCCDNECCGNNDVCLTRAFGGEIGGIEEEICCPGDLTCDGQCCDGDCYNPVGPPIGFIGFPLDPALFERECCPANGSVCQGTANAVCCDDVNEQCCVLEGVAFCAPIEGCCEDIDCLPLPPDSDGCTEAVCGEDHLCQYPSCPEGLECCVNAPEPACLDLSVDGVCCTTPQCENGCEVCEATVCVPLCAETECCMASTDPSEWFCLDDDDCCFDDDCGETEACCAGACLAGACCVDDDCDGEETCCILGDLSFCLDLNVEGACCTAGGCPPPSGECLVAVCTEFECGESGDPNCCDPQCGIGQQCCPAGYCIPFDRICCNAATEVEDCPEGYACCGGFCQLGECCMGIADDGRCGDGSTCCFAANGNFCVEGISCPTTTTSPPTTTTTTSPPTTTTTTSLPTTTAAPACNPATCAAQNRCEGSAWLTHECVGNACTQTSEVCQDSDICTENFCTPGVGCESRLRTDTCNPSTGVVCCPREWDCLFTTLQCNCSSGNVCSDGSCGNLCCTAEDCQSQEMGQIPCVACVDNACIAVNDGMECQGSGTCSNRICVFG